MASELRESTELTLEKAPTIHHNLSHRSANPAENDEIKSKSEELRDTAALSAESQKLVSNILKLLGQPVQVFLVSRRSLLLPPSLSASGSLDQCEFGYKYQVRQVYSNFKFDNCRISQSRTQMYSMHCDCLILLASSFALTDKDVAMQGV